ncbi:MAG: EI24 domain-containing protein [Chitinophagaceae bacterium]
MLKEIVITIQSWGQAHRFIIEHKLWKWVIIPGLIYTALFVTGMYFFAKSATAVIDYITHFLHLGDWAQKVRNSFLGFLFAFEGVMLWLTLLLFYFSFFKYICLIIGSPVFAYLSRKTELIIEGSNEAPAWAEIKKEMKRGIQIAIRNCGRQTLYLVFLILLSLIPVIGWVTPLIVVFLECFYYGFSMLDYSFERNNYSVQKSIHFIGRHKGFAIGNGILFYLMHLVIIVAPAYAIVAGTLTVHKVKN